MYDGESSSQTWFGKFIILSIGDLIEIETIIEETLYNTIIIRY
ncbi:hypothetical protein ACKZ7T_09560 [Staphylococcus aureus]